MAENPLDPEPRPNPRDNESDNEEVVDEEGNILNLSQISQSSNMGFPKTLQIQREIFILRGDYITPQDAEDFYEQAQRMPHLHIKQCMQRQAIDLLHVKIMTDQSTLSVITNQQRPHWQNLLPIESVGTLVMQYFCKNKRGDHTLAELFAKVPFHYSLSSDEEELVTYMAYKEIATDHERGRRITASQHAELIAILKKRLPRGSRIQADYVTHKSRDDESPKTWEVAMLRIIAVVTAARETIRMSRSYGNPDIVYSFPSTAVLPPRSTIKLASTLAIRDVDSNLAVHSSLDVPLVAAVRVCRSCGNPAHILNECPVLHYTDTNNDHACNWSDSFVGKAWLAQERHILSGYETRERYHPAGSLPYLMCQEAERQSGWGKRVQPKPGEPKPKFRKPRKSKPR